MTKEPYVKVAFVAFGLAILFVVSVLMVSFFDFSEEVGCEYEAV